MGRISRCRSCSVARTESAQRSPQGLLLWRAWKPPKAPSVKICQTRRSLLLIALGMERTKQCKQRSKIFTSDEGPGARAESSCKDERHLEWYRPDVRPRNLRASLGETEWLVKSSCKLEARIWSGWLLAGFWLGLAGFWLGLVGSWLASGWAWLASGWVWLALGGWLLAGFPFFSLFF